jgi:hypothetical protein
VTEKGLSVDATSKLTGIKLAVQNVSGEFSAVLSDTEHPLTQGLDSRTSWKARPTASKGDVAFGPLFYCTDKDAHTLAVLDRSVKKNLVGKPVMAVKQMDDWRSIWCGVPEIPSALLRRIAGTSGVHVYSDSDDVVYASNVMVSVAVKNAGERVIRLPKASRVVDAFTGEVVSESTKEFKMPFKQCETRMWWLEPKDDRGLQRGETRWLTLFHIDGVS